MVIGCTFSPGQEAWPPSVTITSHHSRFSVFTMNFIRSKPEIVSPYLEKSRQARARLSLFLQVPFFSLFAELHLVGSQTTEGHRTGIFDSALVWQRPQCNTPFSLDTEDAAPQDSYIWVAAKWNLLWSDFETGPPPHRLLCFNTCPQLFYGLGKSWDLQEVQPCSVTGG